MITTATLGYPRFDADAADEVAYKTLAAASPLKLMLTTYWGELGENSVPRFNCR